MGIQKWALSCDLMPRWGGIFYFAGGLFYTVNGVRAAQSNEFDGAWHSVMSLLGTLSYMMGAVAYIFLALSVHDGHLREQRRHAVGLIKALAQKHADEVEIDLENELEERLLGYIADVQTQLNVEVARQVTANVLRMRTATDADLPEIVETSYQAAQDRHVNVADILPHTAITIVSQTLC